MQMDGGTVGTHYEYTKYYWSMHFKWLKYKLDDVYILT